VAAYNGVNYSPLTKCKWACILQVIHLQQMQMGMYVASQDGWMQMGMDVVSNLGWIKANMYVCLRAMDVIDVTI